MSGFAYSFPAVLEPDEDGRILVRFPDIPEALTDGIDEAEALIEAADCLSEALAGRIVDDEEIPSPRRPSAKMRVVSPEPVIASKAALYTALRRQRLNVRDLACLLKMDQQAAARLISPKARTRLSDLENALAALGYTIAIEVHDRRVA